MHIGLLELAVVNLHIKFELGLFILKAHLQCMRCHASQVVEGSQM